MAKSERFGLVIVNFKIDTCGWRDGAMGKLLGMPI